MAFAKDFVWGAASSAYQTEGSPRADGGGESIWDVFCRRPGAVADGFDGSAATDAYRRYEEDIACAAQMGLGAYRFSVSWARVDPYGDGRWNGEGFAFYLRMLQACRAAGLEPYVTLYHWELPQALEDAGGWRSRETARAFARYAAEAARRFSGLAENYITLNEPECTVKLGHGTGVHAPGLRLPEARQLLVLHHQLLAHGLAAAAIRETCPGVCVGIAATGRLCWPGTDSPADVEAACSATFATPDSDWAFTYQMVLDPVCFGHYPENCGPGLRRMTAALPAEDLAVIHIRPDFIGLNIYNGHAVCAGTGKRPVYVPRPRGCAVTALKWPVTPLVMNWGVRFLWQRYGRPIYITENGQSCNDRIFLDGCVHDPDRIDFLHRYLLALRAAAEGGADVRGYFHWALTDNFEWSEGYRERFGLVYIDYVTGARIPKDSAAWYAETVRANGENL